MHLSNERMIVVLLVGAAAGWLIGKVVRGAGFGLVGDTAVGVVGALIGDWLLPRLNFHFWSGLTGMIIDAAIGAVVLLVVLRSLGASGWGGGR
ncbi:MAG: GlsB/YeaQ/YmgE family stress response membrane protein [Roseiarcus sp.]